MDISIIIPTMNRPELLVRLIDYFNKQKFIGSILIGDSSNKEIFEETKNILESYLDNLNICHRHLPGHSVAAAVRKMNEYLKTPYVCLVPDDDFLVPQTIEKCINFLDDNLDYIAAHGVGAVVSSYSGKPEVIDNTGYYPQTVIQNSTASARLCSHLENYRVSLFSVHRTEVWRKMFIDIPLPSETSLVCDSTFRDELLPCCLSVVYGKIKQLDELYLIRQVHGGRYLLPGWYQWITNDNWQSSFLWFRDKVATTISELDGIPLKDAQEVVDLSFSKYLQKMIKGRTAKGFMWRMRKIIKQVIPSWGLTVLRRFRSKVVTENISIEWVMKPSSLYHKDFMPIYNIVTKKDKT